MSHDPTFHLDRPDGSASVPTRRLTLLSTTRLSLDTFELRTSHDMTFTVGMATLWQVYGSCGGWHIGEQRLAPGVVTVVVEQDADGWHVAGLKRERGIRG